MAEPFHPQAATTALEQRQILGRAARQLASAQHFDETLRQAIAACLPGLGDFGFFDVVTAAGVRRTVAAHQAPDLEALLAATAWVKQEHPELNLCALSTGQAAFHPDTGDAWCRRVAGNRGHLGLPPALAFRSMISVPMRYRGEVLGALTLFMDRSGRRHGAGDLAFAAELADLAAPLVANARLREQHRSAEEALRQSEARLRMAVEAHQVGIWDWDIVNNRVSWSDRVYEMHQMPVGSDTGGIEGFRARVLPEDLPRVQAAMAEALAGGAPYAVEFRSPLPDGCIQWISTRSQLVRDASGRPLRMVGASTDVTERVDLLAAERRARAEAEAARRRMELLAGAGEVLARSLHAEETLQGIAQTLVPAIADWCRIDLLDEQGQLQRRLAHHVDPLRSQQALAMAKGLPAAGRTPGAMSWVVKTGQAHYVGDVQQHVAADPAVLAFTRAFGMRVHFSLPLVARGRTIGALAVLQAESGRDFSEGDRALVQEIAGRAALALDNARLFTQAEAARLQAESANRAKDEFLAMLGHELRNPLAPIASTLELMARREPHGALEERRVIGRQVEHLSRLIDDLLDISRITQGKIELRRERLDLRTVLASAVELTRPLFEKRPHGLQLQQPDTPVRVEGDAVRLAQVVANLLVNAAKFTPADGEVSLRLRVAGGEAEVAVRDTGCGIPAELLPQVFSLFVQGRQDIARQTGGLGLGLTIVRSLAQLHGGTVAADSGGPGRGSCFTVRLPLAGAFMPPAAAPRPPPPAAPAPAGGARILVVDDNTDAAETLADLLRMMDYEVRTAADAQAGLEAVRLFAPQLALLDIGLPDVDGYELAARIRRQPEGRAIRLVALTGYGQENDRRRALAAGFDEHLVKPADIDRLLAVMAGLLAPAA